MLFVSRELAFAFKKDTEVKDQLVLDQLNWITRPIAQNGLKWVLAMNVETYLPLILPSFDLLQVPPRMVIEQVLSTLFDREQISYAKRYRFLKTFDDQKVYLQNMSDHFTIERAIWDYQQRLSKQPLLGYQDLDDDEHLIDHLADAAMNLAQTNQMPAAGNAWLAFMELVTQPQPAEGKELIINRLMDALVEQPRAVTTQSLLALLAQKMRTQDWEGLTQRLTELKSEERQALATEIERLSREL